MLHVTGVIISTVFFLHLLRMGHEKRDCIALIGLVIIGLKLFFFFFFFFTLSPPVWCEGMTKSMWAGIGTLDYTWRA